MKLMMKRRRLRAMTLAKRQRCDIVYCNNRLVVSPPCKHKICGACLVRLVQVGEDYSFDCPLCRHNYLLSKQQLKKLILHFGKDLVVRGLPCFCRSCPRRFDVFLEPCPHGCYHCADSCLRVEEYDVEEDGDMDDEDEGEEETEKSDDEDAGA